MFTESVKHKILLKEKRLKMKRITLAMLMVVILLLVGCTVVVKPEKTETNNNSSSSFDGLSVDPSDNPSVSPFDENEIKNMSNEKIECADSNITDVYSKVTLNEEDDLDKAEYKINQGKDGTKYSAELKFDSKEYTYYFTIDDEGGQNLLSLSTQAPYYGDVFKILDLNMDGYADIQFLIAEGTMNSIYDFYIWDASVRDFVKVECDDELLFRELEVCDGYLQFWGMNDGSSGVIEKYKWDGNKLVKMSEEEYHADDEASSEDDEWKFTPDDIKLEGKTILGMTYEQLLEAFGEPVETKQFQVNIPESDTIGYFYVCVYDDFECEFYSGENKNGPAPTDTVWTFDLTGPYVRLDCELRVDTSMDDLDLRYSINKFYDLNETEESYDLNNIRTILENYKPEGYYSEYDKAAIVYCDPESFGDSNAKALVLLSRDDYESIQRIVLGYPAVN